MEPPIKPGESWRMTVFGHPTGQGSMNAIPIMRYDKELGRKVPVTRGDGTPMVNVTDQKRAKLKPWRSDIAQTAIGSGWPGLGVAMLDEAVFVRITFFVARPESHYGTGRNAGVLKNSAPLYPETTGDDVDKLARAALDALKGIIWRDDKRIVTLPVRRRFSAQERMELVVRRPRYRTVGEVRELRSIDAAAGDRLADELQLDLFAATGAAA